MANERKEIERERLSKRERGKRNTVRQYTHTHTQIDRYLYGTLIHKEREREGRERERR